MAKKVTIGCDKLRFKVEERKRFLKGLIIMADVWRIHLRKGKASASVPIGAYCIKNQIAAMGWKLKNNNAQIKNYADYENCARAEGTNYRQVKVLAEKIKPGDFIWTYYDKQYYLAKIGTDSKYNYNLSDEAIRNDACNELTNVHWKAVGDCTAIDEIIINGMQRGQTLRRICNPKKNKFKFERVLKFSCHMYEKFF